MLLLAACSTNHPVSYYLGIYTALGILQSACTMTGSVFLAIGAVRASRLLHKHMLKTVLRAPMSFFDMTPLGRIVNRFSKDMYMIDEMIPESIFWCLFCFFIILSIIVVISYTTPIFLPVVVPIGIVYFFTQVKLIFIVIIATQRRYLCTCTEVLCGNISSSHETGICQSISDILSLSRNTSWHQYCASLLSARFIHRRE